MTRALALFALLASGCVSTYTSITPAPGGGYHVTRVEADWTTHSTFLHCQPQPSGDLVCREIDAAP